MHLALSGPGLSSADSKNTHLFRRALASPAGLATFTVALIAVGLMATGTLHAQTGSTNVFTSLFYKAQDFFYNVRYLALLLGAIAVVAIMGGAFSGRFPVQKAMVFAAAIALIGSSGMIVSYFSSGSTVSGGGAASSLSSGIANTSGSGEVLNDTSGNTAE